MSACLYGYGQSVDIDDEVDVWFDALHVPRLPIAPLDGDKCRCPDWEGRAPHKHARMQLKLPAEAARMQLKLSAEVQNQP
jgi:hypothetical protein